MEYIVEMLNIRKEFAGIVANDNITLTLKKGEVHALLGENGAGKSTLMSVLFGMYKPEKGQIKINGVETKITSPNKANELGIGMVHQHFKLVENFTVTENIILGCEPKKFGIVVDKASAAKRIAEISEKYNLNIDPYAKIEDISVGMQQRVEILKMLYRNANVLIFDEPTAVLTPQEINELMNIIRDLIKEGKSVIIITHKLREIKAVADRCTVIRRGKYIGTVDVKDTSEANMAKMMVGREVSFKVEKKDATPGDVVLKINNLSVNNNKKVLGLKNFSIDVKAGEILAVAGVEGNGQSEIVEAITGMRKVVSGTIDYKGENITTLSIRNRIDKGIAHIPEDRHKRGLVLDYNLEDNIALKCYKNKPFSNKGFINRKAIREHAERIINAFDVRSGQGAKSSARSMSGGNQQKAIIGREIEMHPELLIAVQPTRGLDVGSIEYIHSRLVAQRDKGKAVLLISLELDEVLNVADRIAVVNGGELIGIVDAKTTDENEVGLMMAGIRKNDELIVVGVDKGGNSNE
ncbi:MAG: ABC transporter ATP-binding protein [Sarcina sp.]